MKYGVQLFSLRKYLKDEAGYERVFRAASEMGAETVQLSGGSAIPPETIKTLSERYALPICVTHDPFDRLKEDLDGVVAEHRVYGCRNLGIGMMPKEFRTGKREDLDRFIDFLNETARRLAQFDMTISYHNHWFEFDEIEGKKIFDRLLDETDPRVGFIPDTYWFRFRGEDLLSYLPRMKDRVNTLHVKDYKKTLGLPLFRAVGKGEIDFRPILRAASESGVENVVAELDFSPDPLKSTEYSMQTLARLRREI